MGKRQRENDDELQMPIKKRNINNSKEVENNWMCFENALLNQYKGQKWISASSTANYLLRDPLLDWFNVYYKKKSGSSNSTFNMLFENGNRFEKLVYEELEKKFGKENCITIVESHDKDKCTDINMNETICAMKKGIPFIFQGILRDNNLLIQGMPDILVRSDYLNRIIKREEITHSKSSILAPRLHKKRRYHYLVIDIKWSSMSLCANGRNIRNEGRFRAYKGQLAVYNYLLGKIQGYTPETAYILSKSWKIESSTPQKGYNCFDLLGTIDFKTYDNNVINDTLNAILWLRKLHLEGKNWNINQPHIPELYPNASNNYDSPWTEIKKELIDKNCEITAAYHVTVENRNIALQKGIKSWKDKRCNCQNLGINTKLTTTIDSIFSINRQKRDIVRPRKITNNFRGWMNTTPVDFYIDFEVCNETMNFTFNKIPNDEIIDMIGLGWIEKGKWKYRNFRLKQSQTDLHSELDLIKDFFKFMNMKTKKLDPSSQYTTRLIHFSHAEPIFLNRAFERHSLKIPFLWEWLDIREIFLKCNIVIKGALSYSLGDIANAFYENKCIQSTWEKKAPTNGFEAMMKIYLYHREGSKKVFRDLNKYNEIDCKVMWEILEYLRHNHC
jgi:hypothetical protein